LRKKIILKVNISVRVFCSVIQIYNTFLTAQNTERWAGHITKVLSQID